MKTIAITLLGLSVILALTSTVQAGHGCHGMKACKKYMKEPSEEQKTMFKECMGNKAEGTSEDKEEKMKMMTKMGICILQKTKIVVDNKVNMDNFNAGIDEKFNDAEKAALVKKESAPCFSDASKEYKTDEDYAPLIKCMWKAMATACKDGEAEA